MEEAGDTGLPYAPLCDGRLYLRNRVSGSRTNREAIAEFLRDNVIFGDSIVNLIKGTFYEDAFLEDSDEIEEADAGAVVEALGQANLSRFPVMNASPGFDLVGAEGGMEAGRAMMNRLQMIQRAVSPAAIGPVPARRSPGSSAMVVI